MYRPPKQSIKKYTTLPSGEKREEEVDLITEYSWRNFFSTINFAKIMQKLSKGRSHRIWMLVQYKSSVHFRADFAPIAEAILVCASPGPMPVDPAVLPFTKLLPGIRLSPSIAPGQRVK